MIRTYTRFDGGVNNQIGPIVLDDGQAEALMFADDALNWDMREVGLLKYPGNTAVLTSALAGLPTITGMFEYKNSNTNLLELIVCAGTKVYKVSGNAATQLFSGITAGSYFQSCNWDNGSGTSLIILCNGVDKPLQYDGTTCALITFTDPTTIWNDARPQGATVFRNRIFYWGDKNKPHRVYTPRPGTYNNFDNTLSTVDSFDVTTGYGGVLTGLRSLTDNFMVIYKENIIRRLSGSAPFGTTTDPFAINDVTDNFGCIAPRTLVGNDIEHYFLAVDGLRQLKPIFSYGDIDPNQPTYPIQAKINALNYSIGIISNACAVFDKPNKEIWLSVPNGSSSVNNKVFHYKVITKGNNIRGDGEINAASICQFNRQIYHGDYAGQLYQNGSANGYNGTNITATWTGKYIAHDGISVYKRYKHLVLYADADGAGDVIVQWSILKRGQGVSYSNTQSISSGGNAWDSAQWDSALWATGNQNVFFIRNLGRGVAIALKFINTSNTQLPKIRQVDIEFEPFGIVKG